MSSFFSVALGVGSQNTHQEWLEVYYPQPIVHPNMALTKLFCQHFPTALKTQIEQPDIQALQAFCTDLVELAKQPPDSQTLPNLQAFSDTCQQFISTKRPVVAVILEKDAAPRSVPEAYLKLHLLSHRLVLPHGINLQGIFGQLPTVAWTNEGAIDIEELAERQFQARLQGSILQVLGVDKFPVLTHYFVPSGVRIADSSRVRLGAYLGVGTTVMQEGFINFNAGCIGPNMVEGRISAGVMVESGTDLGGGCSIMGTLSGGNPVVISVGKNCLVGANAGLGIPLGDNCTIEAGLYLTAGSKVSLLKQGVVEKVVKALELAKKPNLLFRRNSQTGGLECMQNPKTIELNAELHQNN